MSKERSLAAAVGRSHWVMFATWFSICLVAFVITAVLKLQGGWAGWGIAALTGFFLLCITVGCHKLVVKNSDLAMAWMGMDFLGKMLVMLGALVVFKKLHVGEPYTMFFMLLAMILGLSLALSLSLIKAKPPLMEKTHEYHSRKHDNSGNL